MADLNGPWDPVQLEAVSRAQQAARRVIGVPSAEDRAEAALRRSGHASALRGRELQVLPGGVVVAKPRPRPTRTPPSFQRSAPAGQPRPAAASTGSRAGSVLRIVASGPAAVGNTVANAATGSQGDTALGRLLGAVLAGAVVLELGSLFAKKYFTVNIGGGAASVTPSAPTVVASNAGSLTPAQLAQILGYNPSPSTTPATSSSPPKPGQLTPAALAQILGYNP